MSDVSSMSGDSSDEPSSPAPRSAARKKEKRRRSKRSTEPLLKPKPNPEAKKAARAVVSNAWKSDRKNRLRQQPLPPQQQPRTRTTDKRKGERIAKAELGEFRAEQAGGGLKPSDGAYSIHEDVSMRTEVGFNASPAFLPHPVACPEGHLSSRFPPQQSPPGLPSKPPFSEQEHAADLTSQGRLNTEDRSKRPGSSGRKVRLTG